jgi:protein TonB
VEPAEPPPDPVAPPAPDPAPPVPLDPAPPPDPVELAVPVVEPALPELVLVVLLVEVVPAVPLDVELVAAVEVPDEELPPRPAEPLEVVLSSPPHATIEVARRAIADATRNVTRVIRSSGVMGTRCKQFPAPRPTAHADRENVLKWCSRGMTR